MQTVLCPMCKKQGLMTRCSAEHLESKHSIKINAVRIVIEKVVKLTKAKELQKKKQTTETI